MLPFLKNRREDSVAMPVSVMHHSDSFDMFKLIAKDLVDAVHSRDDSAVAEILRAFADHIKADDEIQDASLTNKEF